MGVVFGLSASCGGCEAEAFVGFADRWLTIGA